MLCASNVPLLGAFVDAILQRSRFAEISHDILTLGKTMTM